MQNCDQLITQSSRHLTQNHKVSVEEKPGGNQSNLDTTSGNIMGVCNIFLSIYLTCRKKNSRERSPVSGDVAHLIITGNKTAVATIAVMIMYISTAEMTLCSTEILVLPLHALQTTHTNHLRLEEAFTTAPNVQNALLTIRKHQSCSGG